MYTSVDLLFASLFSIVATIGVLSCMVSVFLALRASRRPDSARSMWQEVSMQMILTGVVSGRMQLIYLAVSLLVAAVFYAVGMYLTAGAMVVWGLVGAVCYTAIWVAAGKINRRRGLSQSRC